MNYLKSKSYFIYLLSLSLIFSCGLTTDKTKSTTPFTSNSKQKGIHLFGQIDSTNLESLHQLNFNWITLVPYGDQEDFDSPILTHERGVVEKEDSNWVNQIAIAKSLGFKIMIKPHIWLGSPSDQKWRSDIYPINDKNWESWKESYRSFIFRYALIAEKSKAEMLCIGTELTRLSIEKPTFWKQLIREVKEIYSGKIIYAANWYDEYEKITFWNELDYIGIQAYFPLSQKENPSVPEISKGWNKYISSLEAIHKKYDRNIIFTEIGYKSTPDSGIEPWKWIDYTTIEDKLISIKTQSNLYQAFFNSVWENDWFEGVHLWHHTIHRQEGHKYDSLDFSIQNKPVSKIIKKGFE